MRPWLLLLALTACADATPTYAPGTTVSPALVLYVLEFEMQWSKVDGGPRAVTYPVVLRNDTLFPRWDPAEVGRCTKSFMGPHVEIRSAAWSIMQKEERAVLIAHELSHCSLDRDHEEAVYVGGPFDTCPLSIMYPDLDPVLACFDRPGYTEALTTELFDPRARGTWK